MFIGRELIHDPNISIIEKVYISILGVPINGLRNRVRRVLPLIKAKHHNILDAGCGEGIFTFDIARRFSSSQVTGIDIDNELLKRNRLIADKIDLSNCEFKCQDILSMNMDPDFDLLISIDNLEHIDDDERALSNFYDVLKNGGELVIHVPGYYRRWVFFKWKENFEVEGHCRPGYTKEQIEKKIESAGFKILDSYYTYGWLETITNNVSYLITGARKKNKSLYALVFPLLLLISYLGRNSRPKKGAGVLVRAKKV